MSEGSRLWELKRDRKARRSKIDDLIATLEDLKAVEVEVEHCYYLTNFNVSPESSFMYTISTLGVTRRVCKPKSKRCANKQNYTAQITGNQHRGIPA
jgi:hypothetical protein